MKKQTAALLLKIKTKTETDKNTRKVTRIIHSMMLSNLGLVDVKMKSIVV